MRTQTYNLTNEGVTLTTYLLDSSPEMAHIGKRGSVLICTGGAYKFCSDREAEPIAMHFLGMGYNAFILRYSLNENSIFPKPLEDADEAMAFIIENAEDWNVDTEKIAVCGFSAGGHLAAALGTMGKVRPAAMILAYPCISEDICNEIECLYNRNQLPVIDKQVDDKTPPAFIFAAVDDGCVPVGNSLSMAKALNERNIPFEMHIYSKGNHGFSTGDYVTCNDRFDSKLSDWIPKCKEWLYELFFAKTIDK